ncbi:MAG: hypothetical protein ABIJ96_03490 [Elusimicrobiota bacterium]
MNKKFFAALITLGAIAAIAAESEAGIIRVAPIPVTPISLPNVAFPVLPVKMAILPMLPTLQAPTVNTVGLPGPSVPVVQINPIEQPAWPVAPITLNNGIQKPGITPTPATDNTIEKVIEQIGDAFRIRIPHAQRDGARIRALFDGSRKVSASESDVVYIPEPDRPTIDRSSRPQTLPEDDLLRDLGF